AVAIAAAVIGDGGTMPTAGALIEVTAECGSPTARNGQQHFDVLPADPLAVSFDEGNSGAADDIGHLQRWPAHLFHLWRLALERQGVQRTGGRMQVRWRGVQVAAWCFQIVVAYQYPRCWQLG